MSEWTKAHDGKLVVMFEGLNDPISKWTFRWLGKRCPNRGEFYLSGAIPQAYKAKQHLTTEYDVVEPTREYRRATVWLPKK